MEIKTQILINATPDQVWNKLTDFNSYPTWNPFVQKLEGEVKEGNTIKVQLPGMRFTPKVLQFKHAKEFRWLGHLLFKGLFDGEHIFQLFLNEDGTTTFIHMEIFKGILIPLFRKKLLIDTKEGFEQMNQALKNEVENER